MDLNLTDGEWNVIIHALSHKTTDKNNSEHAQKQYEDVYVKVFEHKYGEGTCPLSRK